MIYNKTHKNARIKKSRIKKSRIRKSKTKKSIPNKTINILSYNISWESMTGNVSTWELCSNNTDNKNPKHYSVCVNNIANVINDYVSDNQKLDFITLQEATDFYKLIEYSPILKQMKYETHKSGLDNMVTLWSSNYKLLYTIKGEFEKGRPWLATILQCSKYNTNIICLINVHFGHYNKNEEYSKLDTMILTIKKEIIKKEKQIKSQSQSQRQSQSQSQIQSQSQSQSKSQKNINIMNINKIRYIISGDFNYNIKELGNSQNKIIINETTFYHHPKHILTCCINRTTHFDHVIDSLNKPIDIYIPDVKYMASDHKPIIVKLVYK